MKHDETRQLFDRLQHRKTKGDALRAERFKPKHGKATLKPKPMRGHSHGRTRR